MLGRLPPVCVFDGVPAGRALHVTRVIGADRLGIAWLLVLLGPPGWLGLLIIAGLRGRDETLTVQLPCSAEAGERCEAIRRHRRDSVFEMVGCVAAALALLVLRAQLQAHLLPAWATACSFASLVLLAMAAGVAARAGVAAIRGRRYRIGVTLDASRRWVTLQGVHEQFAQAVWAAYHSQHLAS